jgi:hypothetical protein
MTNEELRVAVQSLKQKVLEHDVIGGRAVVILPAHKADEFADAVLKLLEAAP